MVCYFKKICGINQAEDRVTWPDLLYRCTSTLASFREWSVVSAWLRIWAQPRNPCQPPIQLWPRPVNSTCIHYDARMRNFLDNLKDCLATRMRQNVHFMNLFKSLADIVGLKFRWVFCCNWIFIILQIVVWSQGCIDSLAHHGRDWQRTIPLHEIPALDLCKIQLQLLYVNSLRQRYAYMRR